MCEAIGHCEPLSKRRVGLLTGETIEIRQILWRNGRWGWAVIDRGKGGDFVKERYRTWTIHHFKSWAVERGIRGTMRIRRGRRFTAYYLTLGGVACAAG